MRPWRRLAEALQAAAVLGLPFVRVGGESALRLDVPSLRLFAFGADLAIDELFVVVAALLFLGFAFLLVTVAFGRVWCGWACPQSVLSDLTAFVVRARRRGGARLVLALGLLLLASALVAADLLWYFVPPGEFFRRAVALRLGPVLGGSWAVLTGVLFLDLAFLRHGFCATACPYARLQGALFDRATLAVLYDPRRAGECIDCEACVRVCPVGIDIRAGPSSACIACAECIDACNAVLGRKRVRGLIGYFFGAPGEPGAGRRLVRPATVGLGAATLASLALFVGAAAARVPLELTVVGAPGALPRFTADGRALNVYVVTLESHARTAATVRLALGGAPGMAEATLRPDRVSLGPGEHRRIEVLAALRGAPAGERSFALELTARAESGGAWMTRRVAFVLPRRPEGSWR